MIIESRDFRRHHSIILYQDKHPRGLTSTSQPDLRSMASGTDASVTGQEHALVELLETEVSLAPV